MLGIRCQICSWEVCGGGFVFLEGGSQKGGVERTPRTPPGYGPDVCLFVWCMHHCNHRTTRDVCAQRKALLALRSQTRQIHYLFCFFLFVCVLFYNIHYYSHAAFVESKTICLRYIACDVTEFPCIIAQCHWIHRIN